MHCRLPVSEGFYNNPGIVDNKNLFVAQNVDNDDNGCLEDQRKILRFDLGAKEG